MNRRLLALSFALVCAVAALCVPAAASAAFGPLETFGSQGHGAGQIESTGSLAVASDGSVYVADYGNNRIDVFSPDGGFKFAFGAGVSIAGGDVCTTVTGCQAGEGGGAAGAMMEPESLALGEGGQVYVADQSNNRVDVFTADGTFVRAFGKGVAVSGGGDVCTAASECRAGTPSTEGGGLKNPDGLDVKGSTVYVADTFNDRIAVYDTDGTFRYTFGAEVNSTGADVCFAGETCQGGGEEDEAGELGEPYDVKVTPAGQLAVSENINGRISIFTPAGEFVRAMGKEVNPETSGDICTMASGCEFGAIDGLAGSMSSPSALAVDGEGDVFVADTDHNRIDEWSADGAFVKAFGAGVLDGAETFQVCDGESGCQIGSSSASVPGAVPSPFGVAVDCQGGIWTAESSGTTQRVQRFGEAGTLLPTSCPAVEPSGPSTPTSSGSSTSSATKAAPMSIPSNLIKLGKLKLNRKKGTATLAVTVPGPGKLVLSGKGLKKVTKAAKKAGLVSLLVKAVGKAQKSLAKVGKAKLKAKVTFTPTGGTAASKTKSLTLKKKLG